MVGADKIIGIDLNPAREAMARKFGMTHFMNPRNEAAGDERRRRHRATDRRWCRLQFRCIGNTKVMRQALECTHKGWGQSIIIGVAEAGAEISTRPFQLVTGRQWRGWPSAARAAAPTCRRSSTGTWTARSTSTT